MEWIKCSEKLPDFDIPFLCIDENGIQAVAYLESGFLVKGFWSGTCEYGCSGYDYIGKILYWMELPKHPENE